MTLPLLSSRYNVARPVFEAPLLCFVFRPPDVLLLLPAVAAALLRPSPLNHDPAAYAAEYPELPPSSQYRIFEDCCAGSRPLGRTRRLCAANADVPSVRPSVTGERSMDEEEKMRCAIVICWVLLSLELRSLKVVQ